ncbi:MAG: hypothetical protein IJ228_11030 [Succinivibrio sp.]|nr:hypothetical protein [Succinivibrio sp.]
MPAVWDRLTDWCGEEFAARMKTVEYVSDEAVIATEYINAMNSRDWNWRYVRDGVYTAMSQSLKETERRVRQKAAARSKPKVKAAPKAPEWKVARKSLLGTQERKGGKRGKLCEDHLGNKYRSIKAMCDAYGICDKLFYIRRKQGHSIESILTRSVPRTNIYVCKDHLGQEFQSKTAMCEHWGVEARSLSNALKSGKTLEEFLTQKPKSVPRAAQDAAAAAPKPVKEERRGAHRRQACKDHLGNDYPSISAMCKAYGINISVYFSGTRKGLSLEKILTTPPREQKVYKDHLGNEFTSQRAMCEYWGASYGSYAGALKKGMSLEEFLTRKPIAPHTGRRMSCKDHLGNEWPSVKAMCEAYGANPNTFRNLLRKGRTLEDILTHRPARDTTCIDHTGRVHSSIAEMCRYWGVTCNQYQYRIKHGGSLEDALTAK